MIKKSASKSLLLATTSFLGQLPNPSNLRAVFVLVMWVALPLGCIITGELRGDPRSSSEAGILNDAGSHDVRSNDSGTSNGDETRDDARIVSDNGLNDARRSACADVSCSGRGTCLEVEGVTECRCVDGYRAEGLSCVQGLDDCDIYVDPKGDDDADGTNVDTPFATLEGARSAVRALKAGPGLPVGGIQVCLRDGVHTRQSTFELGPEDSGEPGKPIIYRSAGGESARIIGALHVPAVDFSVVTQASSPNVYARIDPVARGKLLQIDLSQYTTDYGKLVPRGGTRSWGEVAALELYVDGARMELARWPDADEAFPFATTSSGRDTAGRFTYSGNRPERWVAAEDIWLHGMWKYYYSDKHVHVTDIDTASKTIVFDIPSQPYYGLEEKEGRPYYAENLLEEITVPGEWYLNRRSGILYLWPEESLTASSEVMVSILEETLTRVSGASHVIFEDLTFEMSRSKLLEIKGGEHILAQRCSFRNGGIDGIVLSDGFHNGIERSEITDIGNAAIIVAGGDRRNLNATNHSIRNNHIHHVAYWSWTYTGAIRMELSVGVTVAHNNIHHTNAQAVGVSGNNNIVEYNDIHDTCLWSGDAGAIYMGRRWDYRGNQIRYNFIHDVRSGFDDPHGVHGVYLDDAVAGFRIFGNIIHRVQHRAINARGGRDTIIQNNVLTRNGAAISIDMAGFRADPGALGPLIEMHYQDEPWASAYPEAAAIPSDSPITGTHWRYAEGSVAQRNVGFGNDQFWREGNYDGTGAFNKYDDISDNLENVVPLYTDEAGGDFSLRPDSPAFQIPGFEDIPFHRIGIEP